jgi:GNAT superfamily N-acetyltransferase
MAQATIRAAGESDLDEILALIDLFTADHPSARHPRPREVMREAFFGSTTVLRVVVAADGDRLVGYAGWRLGFDPFWALWGGDVEGLFVRAERRGRGIGVQLLARVCAEVRAAGGTYLRGTYSDALAPFYERVVTSWPVRETYLAASAFDRLADVADRPIREIARSLPSPELNRIPTR